MLMDFVTDAVKTRRENAQPDQQQLSVSDRERAVSPEKKNPHNRIGNKMENFVEHGYGWNLSRGFETGLYKDCQTIEDQRKPV